MNHRHIKITYLLTALEPARGHKLCKFCENHARDTPLWGVYIPHFDQISVKFSVLGLQYPNRCTDWGEIWHGGGDRPPCQISPQSVQHVATAGRKPQNQQLATITGCVTASLVVNAN